VGYLDNTTVTVDAILTNKGREILAAGGRLNITKFALADDEIDYDLWNPAHTLGTNYYGKVIEDMPVLEALPDETQMMRYKLITLPKDVIGIPVISITPAAITFTSLTQEINVVPSTLNLAGANTTLGYTAILSDDTVASIEVASDGAISRAGQAIGSTIAAGVAQEAAGAATSFVDDETSGVSTAGKTITRTGTKFVITPKPQNRLTQTLKCLLTIVGNETGGFKTMVITVDPTNFSALDVSTSTPLNTVR
jgi:hypothetical protein